MFLLVGGDAEIGVATARRLRAGGDGVGATTRRLELAAPDRPFLDLSSPLDGWEPPPGTHAACVVAAVARLAACHTDPVGSAHVNVTQTIALCERLIARGVYLLFLSTNQVFDGSTPHVPADAPPAPVSEYGRQKARTEAVLRAHIARGAPVAILRLAKVVSPDMALVRDWLAALSAGKPIRAFHDMTLAPTPIEVVADAIVHLLKEKARGIFQLTGPRDVSYEAVGRHLARRIHADEALVGAVSANAAGLPEGSTPRHTTLDSTLLQERYGVTVPDAWEALDEIISG
jgi:dTDP-4-dehydrorhamnose reductase